jgi:SpoVK/Ycf46/Vps4 family AAA+-type ATPase
MKIESKCAVVFFDEIDALGRSRVDDDGGKMSQAGGDNSSRRVLAELLIQMTALNDNECGSESEGDEYGGYCDDGDSFSVRSTGFVERSDNSVRTTNSSGRVGDIQDIPDKVRPKPRIIVVAATNRPEDCDPALLRRFAVRVLVGLPSRKDRRKIIRRLLADVEHGITTAQLDELALATEGWSGSDLESMTREAVMAPVRECLRAAAILKKRESQASQQTRDAKRSEDTQSANRESLLNSFRNLRPVSSGDFEVNFPLTTIDVRLAQSLLVIHANNLCYFFHTTGWDCILFG